MPLTMKYFVLKPKAKSKEDSFASATQTAMFIYADMIQETDEILAKELREWASSEVTRQANMK